MEVYLGLSGQSYNIGDALSDEAIGAEGSICEIIGNTSLVAKIYHDGMTEPESYELENKLKLMISKKIVETQGVFSIAWPRDILYKKKNGKSIFAGYIMRKVAASYNLSDLTHHNPDDPDPDPNGIDGYITWKEFIQAAYNLSRLVEYLHKNGIEIGDFNERNFLFDETTGGFDLIDCGTYGIFDTKTLKTIYPCRYSMPKYSAPEKLLGLDISNPKSTDCFYLAIHIFHLLMQNSEPFGFKENSDGDPISKLHEHISNGDCIYVKSIPGKVLRKHSIKPGVLPNDILEAFNRTFNYTRDDIASKIQNRTTASEWCKVLEPYLTDDSRIIRCSVKKEHVYSSHLKECPWCNPSSVSDIPYEKRVNSSDERNQLGREGVKAIYPNDPCPCGSGKKYKNCHGKTEESAAGRAFSDLTVSERMLVDTSRLSKAEEEYKALEKKAKSGSKRKRNIAIAAAVLAVCLGAFALFKTGVLHLGDNAKTLSESFANNIETLKSGMSQGNYRQMIFGRKAVYCINQDGSVAVYASDQDTGQEMQKAYSSWKDIASITMIPNTSWYNESIIGIKTDGTVIAPEGARVYQGEIDVSEWTNIIQIDASNAETVLALASDGTVSCTPTTRNYDGSPIFSEGLDGLFGCQKVVSVETKDVDVLGLSSSGTVAVPSAEYAPYAYYNGDWGKQYLGWSNLQDISICSVGTDLFGLTKSGNIVYGGVFGYGGELDFEEAEITALSDITAIATGGRHLAALRSDGTVFATGNNDYGQCDVSSWKDIVRIEAYGNTTVGYGSDGKVYYAGYNCLEDAINQLNTSRLQVTARLKGTTKWADVIQANVDDEVEFQIEYENLQTGNVDNVMIRDVLPSNIQYVEGTTYLFNSNYKDGVLLEDDTVTTSGINIGSYSENGIAYVRFTGKIVNSTLAVGDNQLVNWASVTITNTVNKDDVSIMVNVPE